jgi:hypothetical protein
MATANDHQIGGCEPVGAPTKGYQSIRAKLYEIAKDLSPEDYRVVAVTLKATLGVGTTSGSDTYRVPATHEFVIEEIRGHLALTQFDSELHAMNHASDGTKGIGTSDPTAVSAVLSLRDRMLMKAMNCRLDLKNSDREQKVFDNQSLSLASILAYVGSPPADVSDEPHIVPAGETLIMNAALINVDAKMLGGLTEYGVTLVGKLIRVAKS